jgi:hypothetical protein
MADGGSGYGGICTYGLRVRDGTVFYRTLAWHHPISEKQGNVRRLPQDLPSPAG